MGFAINKAYYTKKRSNIDTERISLIGLEFIGEFKFAIKYMASYLK